MEDRALGCLYGQLVLVGDALGARYEFTTGADAAAALRRDSVEGMLKVVPIKGGGPFSVAPGQVTDDSELALSLARSLAAQRTYDDDDVAFAYYQWLRSNPPDIGNNTRQALFMRGAEKAGAYEQISTRARTKCINSLSNGCLMRISPLAVATAQWSQEQALDAAQRDTELTNPNELTVNAVAIYVTMLRELINTGDVDKALAVARVASAHEQWTECIELAVGGDAEPTRVPGPLVGGQRQPSAYQPVLTDSKGFMGYAGIALQNAVHAVKHATSFAAGLQAVIARGGDTDTNGCIAAAALGARFGAAAIPKEWKDCVRKADNERNKRFPVSKAGDIEQLVGQLLACRHS